MTNRIGKFFDVSERARTTVDFCDAICRIHVQCSYASRDVFDKLSILEADALLILYADGKLDD